MLREHLSSADSTARRRRWSRVLLVLALAMGAASLWNATDIASTPLLAQETSKPANAAQPVPEKLPLVFVPVDDLGALLTRDREGVFLSAEEFQKLLDAARSQSGSPETSPVNSPQGAVLSRADYVARIEGDELLLTATIHAVNFSGTWAELPIRIGGLNVESAISGDRPAAVIRDAIKVIPMPKPTPNASARRQPAIAPAPTPPQTPPLPDDDRGQLRWLLDGQAEQTLTLELSAPLSAVGSDRVAVFQLPGIATGELRLTLPPRRFLQVDGVTLTRPQADDQPAEYVVPIGGRTSINFRITGRSNDSRADSLTFASTAHGLFVAPDQVTWTALTSLQVVGREIDRLTATVPAGVEMTGVDSSGLEAWELSDTPGDPNRTTITLQWRQPFDGLRTITWRGILSGGEAGQTLAAPTLRLAEITSHTGVLELRYPAGVRVQTGEIRGARAVGNLTNDLPTLAERSSAALSLKYELWEEDFAIPFTVEARRRDVHAAMTNLLDLNPTDVRLYSAIDVTALFEPLFDVQVTLPAEWEVERVLVAGKEREWQSLSSAAGVNVWQIPLTPPLGPGESRTVQLEAMRGMETWPPEAAPVRVALPEVRLPQAGVVEALFGISADAFLDVTPVDVVGLDPARQQDLERLREKVAATGLSLQFGYSYQDTTFSGQLEVGRKPSRQSAVTLTFVEIGRETVTNHLEAQLRVEGGGVREISVALPESAGEDVRFELTPIGGSIRPGETAAIQGLLNLAGGATIAEQAVTSVRDGLRIWTLRLDRRFLGDAVLSAKVVRPRSEGEPLTPLVLHFPQVDRQSGYIAVVAGPDQRVTVNAQDAAGTPLPLVDPVDFPASWTFPVEQLTSEARRIVASVQYLQPGYAVTVNEERFERTPVPTAVCEKVEFQTVAGRAGELQHQADYRLSAVGVQNLSVSLPEGYELWAAMIDDHPVEVRRVGNEAIVPLPSTPDAAAVRKLRLLYRSEASPLTGTGRLRQTPPVVSILTGAGERQPLEVLEQTWTLHVPPETRLVSSHGRFHATNELHGHSLFQRWNETWELPSEDEWFRLAVIAVIVLFVVGLTGVMYRQWGQAPLWVVGALVLLVALILPSTQTVREAARVSKDTPAAAVEYDIPAASEAAPSPFPSEQSTAKPADELLSSDRESSERRGRFMEKQLGMSRPQAGAAAPTRPDDVFAPPAAPITTAPNMAPVPAATPGLPAGSGDARAAGVPRDSNLAQIPFGNTPVPAQEPRSEGEGIDVQTKIAPMFRRGAGALLSLAVHLTPPVEYRSESFEYAGAAAADAPPELEVAYADRATSRMMTAAIAAGVLLLLWWTRRRSPWRSCVKACTLLAISLALLPLVPAAWMMVVDGLLLGSLLSLGLSLVIGLACCLKRCCGGLCVGKNAVAALLVLLANGVSFADDARTSKPVPPVFGSPLADPNVVIIPYETGKDPLAADRVFLPQAIYLKLWRAAHPDEAPSTPAPVDGLVSEAVYVAELELPAEGTDAAPQIKVTGRLLLQNLTKGPIRLALPLGLVAIDSATLDGQAAILTTGPVPAAATRPAPADGLSLVLEKPGPQVLDLVFRLPAPGVTAESGRFQIPLKPVAAGRLTFTLPAGEAPQIRVQGGGGTYRLHEADGKRQVIVPVDAGGNVGVSWQPAVRRGDGDSLVQVETTIGATFDDAGLHGHHHFRFRVRQGTINEIRLAVPGTVPLRAIRGADVGGWEQTGEGEARRLRIFLRREVADATEIHVETFAPVEITEQAQPITLPQILPEGVSRESGEVVVFAAPHLSVQVVESSGLRQVNLDVTPMGESVARPNTTPRVAYRFAARPFLLTVSAVRRLSETRVAAQHGVRIGLRKSIIASAFEFDLREAPRAAVSFLLPEGYLPIDVQADYLVDWYVTGTADGRLLTIALDQPRTGRLNVFLEGHVRPEAGAASIGVTLPRPLDVQRSDSQLGIWVDDAFVATVSAQGSWRAVDPSQLEARLKGLQAQLPRFAYRTGESVPAVVTVSLTRARPELSGDAVVLTAVSDASIDHGLTLRWTIEQAATDTFTITLPDWLGERVAFQGDDLRRVQSRPLADGTRLWTIELQQPVRGEYLLAAAATVPLPGDEPVQIPDVRFVQPESDADAPSPLAVQRRFLVLVNLSTRHRLTATDATLIEPAARDQLPLRLKEELLDQALEIAALKTSRPLPTWKLESIGNNQAASALVLLADLRTVLETDGSWRTQVDYRVRNRGRQFLAVRLPAEARLLSVTVRGKPSQATTTDVAGRPALLIPLPATSAVDLSFDIRLVLAGKFPTALPQGFDPGGRNVELPAPQVVSASESPESGLPVLQTLWRVDLPNDLHAVVLDSDGRTNMLPGDQQAAQDAYGRSLIEELKQQLSSVGSSARYSKEQLNTYYRNLDSTARNVEHFSLSNSLEEAEQRQILESARGRLRELADKDRDGDWSDLQGNGVLDQSTEGLDFITSNNGMTLDLNRKAAGTTKQDATLFNFAQGERFVIRRASPESSSVSGKEPASRANVQLQLQQQQSFSFQQRPQAVPELRSSTQWGTLADQMAQSAATPSRFGIEPAAAGLGVAMTGLSLPMTLPDGAQRLTFTKISGDPRLTLTIRPRETMVKGRGLAWAVVWIGLALWVIAAVRRGRHDALAIAARVLAIVGGLGVLLLPAPARYAALAVFLTGCSIVLFRRIAVRKV